MILEVKYPDFSSLSISLKRRILKEMVERVPEIPLEKLVEFFKRVFTGLLKSRLHKGTHGIFLILCLIPFSRISMN
jgi:hypothetical protein